MYKLFIHAGSENHGCEAIVRTTVQMLDTSVMLYSRNPEADMKYGIEKICALKFDKHTLLRKGTWEWGLSALQTKITGKIDLSIKYQYQNLIANINAEDICLSIGGDNYCYPGGDILAAINQNIKKKNAKLVLWGCSVEPTVLKDSKVADDLKHFDLITARESISYNVLKQVNKNTVRVADPAFTLPANMLPLPDNWIDNNMVGINASPLILQSGKSSDIVYDSYHSLIQNILQNTDCGIALIPHVVCPGNDDRTILSQLYDEFKNTKRIVLLGDHDCMALKGYIARCRFFVGARTHATIAAYSSCVPTLALGYSVKSIGIARDLFGTDEKYVLPVQKLQNSSTLYQYFEWIFNHEKKIREHLKKVMPDYISTAYLGKDAIENLL